MPQSIKCQPCKLEGLSSDTQSPYKKPGVLQMPIAEEAEAGDSLQVQLNQRVQSSGRDFISN